jgi:uncharacterized protein YdhG (YjbR/CyaY superfamily)
VGDVDEYFTSVDASSRAVFEHIRRLVLTVAPDAEQATSYGMAALRCRGKPLIGFRAASQHLSIFPFSPAVVASVRDRLQGFELSKGTIRFTVGNPLPDDVVLDVVRLRLGEIGGQSR